ncbi:MAG: 23S rRNA (guanosine(2251)-2'-O)-methyltransferase RlmB, partial [Candidatus Obscuribacterales bacterium]|nr:23S rRNA (guanosine(2251)-2'-O)-methyltransferase RlmB [Candidatus Obscuribacterales bacterium]
RRTYGEAGDRPRRPYEDSGDRPRRPYEDSGDRPRKRFEDSGDKPRRTYGEAGDRPRRPYEDSGDRPRKRFEDSGDKPRRTYGEAGDRPRRPYEDSGDRPRRPSEDSGDRPRDRRPRDFDDRRPRRFDGPGSAAADLANLDEEAPPERTRVGRYGSHSVTELPSFDAETQAQVDAEFIYGRNSVVAFLERGEAPVNKIFIAKDIDADKRIDKINALAKENGIPTVVCDKVKLSTLIGDRDRHQGVVAQLAASEFVELPDFLDRLDAAKKESEEAGRSMDGYVIAILDGIEDPHNIGAIIRSADAAGVKAILLPQRRSAGLTATVAKVSAGALANMTVVRVTNIVSTLEKLKDRGFWVAGTSLEGESLYKSDLKRPLALVIGSESDGISRLVAEHCDMLLKIPMQGSVQSLNASVAAGVVFYEIVRQNS